jgi:hypothetical protein
VGRGISWRRGWGLIGGGDGRFGVSHLDAGRSSGGALGMEGVWIYWRWAGQGYKGRTAVVWFDTRHCNLDKLAGFLWKHVTALFQLCTHFQLHVEFQAFQRSSVTEHYFITASREQLQLLAAVIYFSTMHP